MTNPRADETLCDLEQRLESLVVHYSRPTGTSRDCSCAVAAVTHENLVAAAAVIRGIIKLCNERKWSVMIDESGRMEDAVLTVDILRLAAESPVKAERKGE